MLFVYAPPFEVEYQEVGLKVRPSVVAFPFASTKPVLTGPLILFHGAGAASPALNRV